MKRISVIFFFLLLVVGMDQPTQANDIIYGEDEREEVEDTNYFALSPYIGAMVSPRSLDSPQSAKKKHKLCHGQRFEHQPSLAKCTGLLLRSKYILTAAHCLGHKSHALSACRDYEWLFDYTAYNKSFSNTYRCKRVIEINKKLDYAIIELHQKVTKRESFLPPVSFQKKLQHKETFVSLGFPAGVPLKVTQGKIISTQGQKAYFNFDTFHGNSGSPVFSQSGQLIGLLKSGKKDFIFDKTTQCYRPHRCSLDGSYCEVQEENIPGEEALLFSKISRWSKLYRLLTGRRLSWIW